MIDELKKLHFGLGRKLPVILQTEMSECGLACLAMIAGFHGHDANIFSLRRRFSISTKGTTLRQLINYANDLHLTGRPLKLEMSGLRNLTLPCVLHWNLNHFVVLKKVNRKGVYVHDPAFGIRFLRFDQASQHFSGIALELFPSPVFEKKAEVQYVSIHALIGQITGLKRAIFQVLALSVALEGISILSPFFQQWVVDGVIVANDQDLLKVLALGFFLLMVFQMSITTIRSWLMIYFSTQLNLQWMAGVFTHLLRLPMGYFERRHLGDVISRFGSIDNIRQTLTSTALDALLDGAMAIFALVVMLIYSAKLAVLTICAVTLYAAIRAVSYGPFKMANQEQIVHSARQQSHFLESIRGVQSIKLFSREMDRRSQWLNLVINSTNRSIETQRMSTLYQIGNGLIFGTEGILVTYFSALLVMNREFSIGMMFSYVGYKLQFSSRVSSLIDLYFSIKMLKIHRERLADIVLSDREPSEVERDIKNSDHSIEVRNLAFRYSEGDPWVISALNFHIADGEHVAIVGPSGCGKTTLIKILLGLLPASEGEILIGGVPMRGIGINNWRRMVGAVMQEDQLFAGTIAENISFFSPGADADLIEASAMLASIHDDISRMAMGYETLVGDMGTSLSGGQKQRLLLARALYKKPNFLFLDEATSHLDLPREKMVSEAIESMRLTRIIIAHRPETIAKADRVLAIEDGRIVSDRKTEKQRIGKLEVV